MIGEKWNRMFRSVRLNAMLIVAAQAMLAAALATVLAGPLMGGIAVLAVAGVYLLAGNTLPRVVFRISGARPLDPLKAPHIYRILQQLSQRAGLSRVPLLVYLPHPMVNAFTVGDGHGATVCVSRGLLETLGPRELAAVLAHEISHIRNGDTRLLGFAASVTILCQNLSLLGQLFLLLNLPLLVAGQVMIDWTTILLLISAPGASLLLNMALARNREFEADLGAVKLTGDPGALAVALVRIEAAEGRLASRLLWSLWPSRRPDTWLATHPSTARRVERLKALMPSRSDLPAKVAPNICHLNNMVCR